MSIPIHTPCDPDCPHVKEFRDCLYNDPMTIEYGMGSEVDEMWSKKHQPTCERCQEYGAANISVG